MIAPRAVALALLVTLVTTVAPAAASGSPAGDTGDARVASLQTQPAPVPARVVQQFDDHDGDARMAPGRKWPQGKISYADTSKDSGAVKRAVKFWNRSGVGVQFKKVENEKKADLVIRNSKRVPNGCGTGLATLGYTKGRKAYVNILHGSDADGQPCAWPGQTLVMTHELGHVLGLGHDDSKCAIMNSYHVNGVAPGQCFTPDTADFDERPGAWRCRGPERGDLKRAKKLYGGKVEVNDEIWCDVQPRMPAAGPLTAVATGVPGEVLLSLHREPEPALLSFLTVHAQTPYYEVHSTPDACTAVAGNELTVTARQSWTALPGTPELPGYDYTTPGLHCYTVFVFDNLGRVAVAPYSALVQVP